MNIPVQSTRTVTVVPVDVNGNSPALVDGPNSWKLDGVPVPNGTNAEAPAFRLTVAADGNTAEVLTFNTGAGPALIEVSNSAQALPLLGSLSITVVGWAVALNLVVS